MARSGLVTDIGCQDTLLRAEHDQMRLVGVGLKGIVAIAMQDAVSRCRYGSYRKHKKSRRADDS